MTPADENECRQMLYTGYKLDQPVAVRYPRGKGPGVSIEKNMQALPLGQAEVRREGSGLAILAFGPLLEPALEAAQSLDATVVNMRFVKPLDEEMVLRMAEQHEMLVTVDESALGGGGSAINECLMANDVRIPVLNHGLPDRFIEHGEREDMLKDAGLDANGMLKAIEEFTTRHPGIAQAISATTLKKPTDRRA